jgi:hypothetical protein
MLIEARQVGASARDLSGKMMTPCTFDIKFPCGTQFIFESLTFIAGEDGNLRMLPLRLAPERIVLTHV